MTWPLLTLALDGEEDVVAVRQRARLLAKSLGFDVQDQTRIATAVSEIARNAVTYGGGGSAAFAVEGDAPAQSFAIRIADHGPGIADPDAVLEGRAQSATGLGIGIAGTRRLMDSFALRSGPRGTVVTFARRLPAGHTVTRGAIAGITASLVQAAPPDPQAELRTQNRELLASLAELRARQEELARLNAELEDTNRGVVALYAELDERAEELRQASEMKSRFLSNVSHEFRTPLNSVLALSALLLERADGELTAEQERQVHYIRKSAQSLTELVNDLLDLAKVEAGKIELRPSRFLVSDLFATLRGVMKPLQTSATVALVLEDEEGAPPLFTDEGKVSQILRNLVSNALKFTEQGEVRVTARHDRATGRHAFIVRDTGIGIAPKDQGRIFQEFAQIANPLQARVKGTGLGLPLSRRLAELLGGELSVESSPGAGSTFTLSIPGRIDGAPAAEDRVGVRVLVIDDEESFRYVLRQYLAGPRRIAVTEAADGEEGLRQARALHPDLILLDLRMPRLDGYAVLQALSEDAATRAIPVVVCTSSVLLPDDRTRLTGAAAVLPKETLSREGVLATVDAALAARRQA